MPYFVHFKDKGLLGLPKFWLSAMKEQIQQNMNTVEATYSKRVAML